MHVSTTTNHSKFTKGLIRVMHAFDNSASTSVFNFFIIKFLVLFAGRTKLV